MNPSASIPIEVPAAVPALVCAPLPAFDRTNFASIRRAFRFATPCQLRQAWLGNGAARCALGVVRAGWRGKLLRVFAELSDADIFNEATEWNQRTWELGDVFEIFFQAAGLESYLEFHVTPNNHRLQLRYPNAAALEQLRRTGRMDEWCIFDERFYSRTSIQPDLCLWWVYAEIPIAAVCGSPEPLENAQWRFSFSRYDYTRGAAELELSSTSAHAIPDFHRRHEWGVMTFKTAT